MSQGVDYLAEDHPTFAIDAVASERAGFIRRTYAHVFAAVVAYACLAGWLLNSEILGPKLMQMTMGKQWLLVLGAYMAVSYAAQWMARSGASPTIQYAGLMLYTVAFAVISAPLLLIAQRMTGNADLIMQAGGLTLLIFGGLTVVVMLTGADFSFLRTALWLGGIAAMGIIVVAAFTGFSMGLWFAAAMIVLMAGNILYDTSNILHHYRTDQHVSAALSLFASLATLFWYVLRMVMILNRR